MSGELALGHYSVPHLHRRLILEAWELNDAVDDVQVWKKLGVAFTSDLL